MVRHDGAIVELSVARDSEPTHAGRPLPAGGGEGDSVSVDTPALQLHNIRAGYGSIEVLHGVSLVVPAATVVALLGPNGAGKSTTLRVASGVLTPVSGCVHMAGSHVNEASPEARARAGLASVPEGRGIF